MDILNIYFNCSLSLIYEKSKTNINDSNFKSKWTNKKRLILNMVLMEKVFRMIMRNQVV